MKLFRQEKYHTFCIQISIDSILVFSPGVVYTNIVGDLESDQLVVEGLTAK